MRILASEPTFIQVNKRAFESHIEEADRVHSKDDQLEYFKDGECIGFQRGHRFYKAHNGFL